MSRIKPEPVSKQLLLAKSFVSFMLVLLFHSTYGQNPRKVRLSTKSIKVIEGADWSYDASANEDAFNNYVLGLYKDSAKLTVQEITKYYRAEGTRTILTLDSLCRPTNIDGNKEYNVTRYSYQWRWSKDGRLLAIDEYVNERLKRHFVLNKKGSTKRKQ